MDLSGETHAVGRFARWSQRVIASPYAPVISLLIILIALFVVPAYDVDESRLRPVEFGIAMVTLFLVFLVEHNEQRDTIAIHVKLDEILKTLGADERKIGVEELPAGKLEDVRDEGREELVSR